MKRVILAAVFIVAFSGLAAAQSTSAKHVSNKQEKTTAKKTSPAKANSKSTVLKQETSATAKSDSTIKLTLPVQLPLDTLAALPKVKGEEY